MTTEDNINERIKSLEYKRTQLFVSLSWTEEDNPNDAKHREWLLNEIEAVTNGIESLLSTLEDLADYRSMISQGIK